MVLRFSYTTVFALLWALCSCNKVSPGNAPHATVYLRDGTVVSGKVVSSSPAQYEIAGDDNTKHVIPVDQVQSMNYDQPQTVAATPPAGAPPSTATGAAPAAAPASAPPPDASHENHYHPAESAITTKTYVLAAGTQLSVRTEETIDSGRATEGQTFAAEITHDVMDASGSVVIPRGANASIIIRSAAKGGRFRGASDLVLDLDSVSVEGRLYRLDTEDVVERGKEGIGKNKRTAAFTGGGAVIGTIIGAIAGGGKGAAIGAASGAGAGAVTQAATKGGSIKVPAETILTFRLESPLRVRAAQ